MLHQVRHVMYNNIRWYMYLLCSVGVFHLLHVMFSRSGGSKLNLGISLSINYKLQRRTLNIEEEKEANAFALL